MFKPCLKKSLMFFCCLILSTSIFAIDIKFKNEEGLKLDILLKNGPYYCGDGPGNVTNADTTVHPNSEKDLIAVGGGNICAIMRYSCGADEHRNIFQGRCYKIKLNEPGNCSKGISCVEYEDINCYGRIIGNCRP